MTTNTIIGEIRSALAANRTASAAFLGWSNPEDSVVHNYVTEALGIGWQVAHPFSASLVFKMVSESLHKNEAGAYIWSESAPQDFYAEVLMGLIEPDNFQWEFLSEAADNFSGVGPGDDMHEVNPDEVIYFSEAVQWLASDTGRSAYVDDYRDEVGDREGGSNILSDLQAGMYQEKTEVYGIFRQAVEEFVEDFDYPICDDCGEFAKLTQVGDDELCPACQALAEDLMDP